MTHLVTSATVIGEPMTLAEFKDYRLYRMIGPYSVDIALLTWQATHLLQVRERALWANNGLLWLNANERELQWCAW